jgi:hypothetical protein
MDGGSAMDMMEQRIREVFATLLSKGAKVLERTAGELEQVAADLRQELERERVDVERVWAEKPDRESGTTIRGAPLRAVPDTPTDEVAAVVTPANAPWTPPSEPPATEPDATPVSAPADDRIEQIAAYTVSQVRAQLADLSPDELRQLRDVEAANRNRTTLLAAIDRALAEAD